MTRANAPRMVLLILWVIAALFFCYATTRAAPQSPALPCKITYDRALVLVHGRDQIIPRDELVGESDIRPTTAREDFYGLPRVVTVTLFTGDTFAGLLDVRGRGDVLRIRVRGAKDLETCYSGEIDAAIVQEWKAR